MTPEQRASLAAVIGENLAALQRLAPRIHRLEPAAEYETAVGVAYALHNAYNALENIFEQTSRSFENHIVDSGQWHKELLGKMFLEIPGVRPALFQPDLRDFLNDLRSFRHLFRHAYEFELEPGKLNAISLRWAEHALEIRESLQRFADWLTRS